MAGNTNRFSTYTSVSSGSDSQKEQKKDLWQTLLGEVATGKQFPQKNLLVLGDTVASQKLFVEALSNHALRESLGRLRSEKVPEIANSFALGNTYYDVLESDQEGDILARVSVHFLSSPSPSFATLLKQLLTPQSIPNTMVVILLNWSKPWMWMRELREWILLLRKVVVSLSIESKDVMEEVMQTWKDRGRVGGSMNLDGSPGPAQTGESEAALPLGAGEWDEPLGLPLCVVCQNAEKIDSLEKSAWKEEQFDLVLQYLRTVLLKHGASLIYTSHSVSSPLQNLIHSSLGIQSLSSKKDPLKANVIDRDKILVPPNYDSWSKIRVLRDGFEVEEVSSGWSLDLDQDFPSSPVQENGIMTTVNGHTSHAIDEPGSAVIMYEEMVRDPSFDTQLLASQGEQAAKFEETHDTQAFLSSQQKTLEALKLKSEAQNEDRRRDDEGYDATNADLTKKIGPVQFNMGGIQVDADDMVQRLKDRQQNKDKEPTSPTSDEGPPEAKDMEKIQAFFTGLVTRNKRT